jgi:hypothetical protein
MPAHQTRHAQSDFIGERLKYFVAKNFAVWRRILLSGKEFRYTDVLTLLVNITLGSKVHCQNVLSLNHFSIKFLDTTLDRAQLSLVRIPALTQSAWVPRSK